MSVIILQGTETALPTSSNTATTLGRAKLIRLVNTSDTAVLVTVESHGQTSFTRNSVEVRTVTSTASFASEFSGNYIGNFAGNYIGSGDFIRLSTRSSTGSSTGNFTGNFTSNYVGNYTGNFVGLLVSDVRSVTIAAGEVITLRKTAEDRIYAASSVVKGVAVGFVG
jgi:hypothetical protein